MNGISFLPVAPSALNDLPPSMLPTTSSTAASSALPSAQTRSGSSSADSNPGNSAVPAKPAAATAHASSSNTTLTAANLVELTSAESFSTTVGGKQYSGSVQLSNGEYTASVPNLIGATATGSSESAAENNLDARIDELV